MPRKKPPRRGGARPGAGRPRSTGRSDGPRTTLRWSPEEHALVSAAAGGEDRVASWGRDLMLSTARKPM